MQRDDDQFQAFVEDGCGRCSLYKTDRCKAVRWRPLIEALRSVVLACGLNEEFKWSQPCYTLGGKNVLIVSAMKDYAFISFFKGVLMSDEQKKLVQPGERSAEARQLRYTELENIQKETALLEALVKEAMLVEEQGLKPYVKRTEEELPDELHIAFADDPAFEAAFFALTPGRQRGYLIHFNDAKQSKTRRDRIEKHRSNILQGLGMHDAYKRRK